MSTSGNQHLNEILKILNDKEKSFSNDYQVALKKFKKWHAHIERIIQGSEKNPNIIAMAYTQKLTAYSGIIESLNLSNGGSAKKFENFFNLLDEHEKFFVMMAVQIGRDSDERKQREVKIVCAYLKNSSEDFNGLFSKTINNNEARDTLGLYNFRSRLVHQGEFVLAVVDSSGAILPYYSPDLELRIDESIISLDEMFLRGFCKVVNINNISPLISRVKEFLTKNNYARKNQAYSIWFETKFNL